MSGVVGVITRTKNRTVLLERAVLSVLRQTYSNWQMVIVNDGGCSVDVDALVARYQPEFGSRLTVIHNPTSVGMEAASNIGLRRANTDYTLIHDDDDTLDSRFMEVTVGFLESPEGQHYKGVATKVNKVTERLVDGGVVTERRELYRPDIACIQLNAMSHRNLLCPISFLYHRRVHDEVGYYDESLPLLGDWEFYLRFLAKHDVHLLPDVLANYHFRTTTSGDHSNSVMAGAREILRYRTKIKNRLLRADLERGVFGLGAMLSTAGPDNAAGSTVELSTQFIIKQLKNNAIDDVVLYGTGGYAHRLYGELTKHRITVSCVIDSNPDLWGSSSFRGCPISSPAAAVEQGHRTFVVASLSYADEMVSRIRSEAGRQGRTVYVCAM